MKTIGLTKRVTGVVLCLLLLLTCLAPSVGAAGGTLSDDVVILYTNDVHTYIDKPLSYDVIAEIKDELEEQYAHVLLVDAGDHIQGTAYGSTDKGKSMIGLMNAADYDAATLGNHEFDYRMAGCLDVIDWADFPYLSCNFYHEQDGVRGQNVLDSFTTFDCGDETVAFIGITTPETFSKSSPAYFQDENGAFIYGISGGSDGAALYADVQKAINEAKAAGATQVIALGHLGADPSSTPWTSAETIAKVEGLDAFIDGHSHSVVESRAVTDKAGETVVLTQTGEYFDRIGMMVIDGDTGDITTDFIECAEDGLGGYTLSSDRYNRTYLPSDTAVADLKNAWFTTVEQGLGKKVGHTDLTFDNYDRGGNRLVRAQSTNSGDLVTDALYYLFDEMGLDVDLAVMNGGGIRNQAVTGDFTYKVCKDMLPFGNVACLRAATGQQILDMLEWGARYAGAAEEGSFLHVSGMTYEIDTTVPNTTKKDQNDTWTGGPDAYRVQNVKVYNKQTGQWDPLDLTATYHIAGYNYTLRDLGGGFAMLDGSENILDYVMEDYMVLASYIAAFDDGEVGADNSPLAKKYPGLLMDYSNVFGSGRIRVKDGAAFELWVGGTQVTEQNAADVFGDGTVSYDFLTNTLVLNGYEYEGDGYLFTAPDGQSFGIAIYCVGDLTIRVDGGSFLECTYAADENAGIACVGNLTVVGEKYLEVVAQHGIVAQEDVVIGEDAKVVITATGMGIIARKNVTVTDSTLTVDADGEGIYAIEGRVAFNGETVKVSARSPRLEGTTVSITSKQKEAVLAYRGILIDGTLTVSSPKGATVLKNRQDESYFASENEAVRALKIEPLACYVTVRGLSSGMRAILPVGQSLNAVYCERYRVDDFSEVIHREKEGYVLVGWYTDEACSDGNEMDFDRPVTADMTIYAKWVPVTLDGDEDGGEQSPPTGDTAVAWGVCIASAVLLAAVTLRRKRETA